MNQTLNSLKIISWNSASLPSRMGELRELVSRTNPDIVLVQETQLNPTNRVSIPNYSCYRDDRQPQSNLNPYTKHGTAIFIRSTIPHFQISSPNMVYTQATVVQFTLHGLPPFNIASVYVKNRPGHSLINELETLTANHSEFILCGDFNAHHRRWTAKYNAAGSMLSTFSDNNSFDIIAPPTPTRYGTNSQSTIDLVLARNIPFHHKIESLQELSSDHNPVACDFFINADVPRASQCYKTNWPLFTQILEAKTLDTNSTQISNTNQLNLAVSKLTNDILSSHKSATKIINTKSEIYTPLHIKDLIRTKNRIRRLWQRHRDPQDKVELNRIQNRIKTALRDHIQQDWSNYLSSLDPEDGSLFRATKRCKRANFNIPPLKIFDTVAYSDNSKAEFLASTYENQFQNNPSKDPNFDEFVHSSVEELLAAPPNHPIAPVNPEEIITYISKLKIKKAPGRDGITNKMVKNLPPNAVITIATILTAMLNTFMFPSIWKSAVIIPILKPGKESSDPESYRPISLLPILGKIAEVIIKNRLLNFLEEYKIIIPHQFGFMKQLSTTHQLLRVTEYIAEGFTNRQSTGAIFLDVAKAFDRVWIPGLIHKLVQYRIPTYLVHLIHSYLNGRSFVVQVKKSFSTPRKINAGTPQGSVLGPLLFNLYINDIPSRPPNKLALFADDTAVLARGLSLAYIIRSLQHHINELETWLDRWRIKINVSKSAAVMFTRKLRDLPAKLKMYGTELDWLKTTRYLGVILDSRLTWKPHLQYISDKYRLNTIKLNKLIGRHSPLNLQNKLLLYKVIMRPVITYAAPVWGGACRTTLEKFERLQSSTLRHKVICANRYMRNDDILKALNIPSLKKFIGQMATKFFSALDLIDNTEIQFLAFDDYDHTLPKNLHRPRASLALV